MVHGGSDDFQHERTAYSQKEIRHELEPIISTYFDEILELATHCSKKKQGTAVASASFVVVAFVNLVHLAVTTTNWLPCQLFGRDPSMSMPPYLRGPSGKTI